MQSFNLDALVAASIEAGRPWTEFLRVASLSMGIYVLKAGAVDLQKPHSEDEVYVVLSGRGAFIAAGERKEVVAGTILYVERGVEHRFVDIVEDLTVLVLFSPPEGSRAQTPA